MKSLEFYKKFLQHILYAFPAAVVSISFSVAFHQTS